MHAVHHNTLSDTDSMVLTKTGLGSDVDIIFDKHDRTG